MLSVTACRPDAAMLIMVFFTLLSFLEESPSHPYPAGNYALIKKIKKKSSNVCLKHQNCIRPRMVVSRLLMTISSKENDVEERQ